MRSIWEAWFCHIEVNNFCPQNCAYCTRHARHVRKDQEYNMDLDMFRKAALSLDGFPGRLGIIGGEPLLHPQLEEICLILKDEFKIPKNKMGFWTSGGRNWKKYEPLIRETFGMVAYNEHNKKQREVQLHQPLTIASGDVIKDEKYRKDLIDKCWVQNTWCPSINPKGGFFCEVAQALDILLDGPGGYPIEPEWWRKTPKEFKDQVDRYCNVCGAPVPIERELLSSEKEKISSNLLALFKKHNLRRISSKFVDVFEGELTIKEMEENKLDWDPRHYRQDLRPDIKEGYRKRPPQASQTTGSLEISIKK